MCLPMCLWMCLWMCCKKANARKKWSQTRQNNVKKSTNPTFWMGFLKYKKVQTGTIIGFWESVRFLLSEKERVRRRRERKRKRKRKAIIGRPHEKSERPCWTWTKRSYATSQTRVKRVSWIDHHTNLSHSVYVLSVLRFCPVLVAVVEASVEWGSARVAIGSCHTCQTSDFIFLGLINKAEIPMIGLPGVHYWWPLYMNL